MKAEADQSWVREGGGRRRRERAAEAFAAFRCAQGFQFLRSVAWSGGRVVGLRAGRPRPEHVCGPQLRDDKIEPRGDRSASGAETTFMADASG